MDLHQAVHLPRQHISGEQEELRPFQCGVIPNCLVIMTARKVIRRGTRRTVGKFPTLKPKKRCVHWESMLERDFYYLLEIDHDVISYREQPLKIEYFLDGKKHRYTPDLLVERAMRKQIVEVKPKKKVQKYDSLFRIASRICQENGYEFLVVTDEEIRAQPKLDNIKLLWRYSRTHICPQHQIACHEFFGMRNEASLREVLEFFASGGISQQVVYGLLYWGILEINLMIPIDVNSTVSLPRTALDTREG
jgi:hypothetical protein